MQLVANISLLVPHRVILLFLQRAIEGSIVAGARCLVVDDVISSGGSILETVASLEKEGIVVKMAVVLLDREQGADRNLRERGIMTIR